MMTRCCHSCWSGSGTRLPQFYSKYPERRSEAVFNSLLNLHVVKATRAASSKLNYWSNNQAEPPIVPIKEESSLSEVFVGVLSLSPRPKKGRSGVCPITCSTKVCMCAHACVRLELTDGWWMSGKQNIQRVRTALIVGLLLLQDGGAAGCSFRTWIPAVGERQVDLTSLTPPDIPGLIRLFLQLSMMFHFAHSDSFNPKWTLQLRLNLCLSTRLLSNFHTFHRSDFNGTFNFFLFSCITPALIYW